MPLAVDCLLQKKRSENLEMNQWKRSKMKYRKKADCKEHEQSHIVCNGPISCSLAFCSHRYRGEGRELLGQKIIRRNDQKFLNLLKNINLQTQEAQQILSSINTKKTSTQMLHLRLLRAKEESLKDSQREKGEGSRRGKGHSAQKEPVVKMATDFSLTF